jgi:hypothetical protein
MHHRIEAVFGHEPVQQFFIADVAFHQPRLGRDRPPVPGREIIQDDDVFAGIRECQNHMAADIACAARDQDTHARPSFVNIPAKLIWDVLTIPCKCPLNGGTARDDWR